MKYYIILTTLVLTTVSFSVLFGQKKEGDHSTKRILIVTSNQHTYGQTELNTANHFSEIVLAYDVFIKAGYIVDFVSPEGGAIPVGYIKTSDPIQKKYLYDASFMARLKNTLTPKRINFSDYVAVYYSGGGAAMFGVPDDKAIQAITSGIYQNGGVVSAVCHGTAGLVHLKVEGGTYLYAGKRVAGFPDKFERKQAEYYQQFPFSIEASINDNGGIFSYSEKGWDGFYVVDGRLVTGQDPTGSALVAQKVIEIIQSNSNNN
ncbi:MAG: type 1 glutamine amidotransferase domain-containing protein [Bacteroidota bacterium]